MRHPARRRTVPVLLAVVASLNACSAGSPHAKAQHTNRVTTTTALHLAPGQVDHLVDTSFQYGSFIVTVGHVVYDPNAQKLLVGIRFHNTSDVWGKAAIEGTLVQGGGNQVAFSGQPFDVPPGATIDVTGSSATVASDPTSPGLLRWGSPARDQPVVRLDGNGGTNLWLPRKIPLDGWAHIGKFGVHATSGIVNAGLVSQGIQAPTGKRILRVICDAYTNKGTISPFTPKDNLLLGLPDGTTVDALDGSRSGGQLSWVQQGGAWADFPIPNHVSGRYELLLASMPKVGFGVPRPELIERRPVTFTIGALSPGNAPVGPPPVPDLRPPGTQATGKPIDRALHVGTMNVPGYLVTPTHLHWDPATATVELKATVSALAGHGPGGAVGLAGVSGLSATPQFGFSEAIVTNGRPLTGIVSGSTAIDPDKPTPITLTFSGASSFDADDAALFIGPRDAVASSMPLGSASKAAAYPDAVSTATITAPSVTAGSWTVALRAARFGLLDADTTPPAGFKDLEITFDVRAAPDAAQNAFGLSFSARYQLLLAGPSGYDTQAIAGNDPVQQKPGQTLRYTATFEVPETFHSGTLPFVLRSRSEVGDLTTSWIESRFSAAVGPNGSLTDLGGPS